MTELMRVASVHVGPSGRLTKKWGLNGYVVAQPGHAVYRIRNRYVIFLQALNTTLEELKVPFF
jgi:hypothetical protein